MRSGVYFCCLALGVFLIALNIISLFRAPIAVDLAPYKAPANYYQRSLSPTQAMLAASKLSQASQDSQSLYRLFSLISDSFVHIPDRGLSIEFLDNWYLYLSSFKNPRHLVSQDPDFLWRRGAGFCDQAAMIFVAKAEQLGFKSRLVWLSGHVLAEVELPDKGWQVFDVDTGITWDNSMLEFGKSISLEQVLQKFEAHGFEPRIAEKFAKAYVSQEDNKITGWPYYPRLYRIEKRSQLLIWLIPIGLIVFGLAIRAKST